MQWTFIVGIAIVLYLAGSIRVLRQYERGVVFLLGRFEGIRGPGLTLIFVPFQQMVRVSLRTVTMQIPSQKIITKDNVSIDIAAVAYYRISDPEKAVIAIENVYEAINQISQTTVRNVVGRFSLDQLLAETANINEQIKDVIDRHTEPWGTQVTAVEIKTPTKRFPAPVNGLDRDAGEGAGHLFKFDAKGNLLADLPLGEGSIYHPGGIDYDGKHIWVPVAEYRPNSRSIVYRVDPATMKAEEVFRYGDHVGGIVHNTDDNALHGVSWGSRRFYRWTLDAQGKVTNADVSSEALRKPNRANYIDYQDCKYLGRREMLCSGLNGYQMKKDGPRFALGGFEIVDLASNVAIQQVPVELWTESGLPMTQNPFWVEATATGLRAYFMPEDEKSTIYVYENDAK